MSKTQNIDFNENLRDFILLWDEIKTKKMVQIDPWTLSRLFYLFYGRPYNFTGCSSCQENTLRSLHSNYIILKDKYSHLLNIPAPEPEPTIPIIPFKSQIEADLDIEQESLINQYESISQPEIIKTPSDVKKKRGKGKKKS